MTFRKAIWIGVGVGALVALVGAFLGSPGTVLVGVLLALLLVPAAWIAFLVMGVRWVLTGDPKGTIGATGASPSAERTYQVLGRDRTNGSPRTMSIRAASSRDAAAAASDCGIEVQEIR